MKYKILFISFLTVFFAHGMEDQLAMHVQVFTSPYSATPTHVTQLIQATEFINSWAKNTTNTAITPKEKKGWLYRCAGKKDLIIPFLSGQIQEDFENLFNQEFNKADISRWPKIQELLPGVGTFIALPDDKLKNGLIKLAKNEDATHNDWFKILQSYKSRTTSPKPKLLENKPIKKRHQAKKKPNKKKSKKKKQPGKKAPKAENATTNTNNQRFWVAVTTQNIQQVSTLLQKYKDEIPIDDAYGQAGGSALYFAAQIGNIELCKMLLAHNANPNHRSLITIQSKQDKKVKTTPLLIAINIGQLDAARVLLEHKADPNTCLIYHPRKRGSYALDLAAAEFSQDDKYTHKIQAQMIALLLQYGAYKSSGKIALESQSYGSWGYVDLSNKENREMILALLKIQKPENTIQCQDGNILFLADEKKVNSMIAEDSNSDSHEKKPYEECFWNTLDSKNIKNIESVLKQYKDKIDISRCHFFNKNLAFTPLYYAVALNNPELCRLLVDYGADPNCFSFLPLENSKGEEKATPLIAAVDKGRLECARELLMYNADPNIPLIYTDGSNMTYALDCAASPISSDDNYTSKTQKEMIALLLLNGATKFSQKAFLLTNLIKNEEVKVDFTNSEQVNIINELIKEQTPEKTISCQDGNIFFALSDVEWDTSDESHDGEKQSSTIEESNNKK